MARIPLFYRLFFLYIDPLICLSGIYLFFFDHTTYILAGTPNVLTSPLNLSPQTVLPPLTRHLIMAIGSYSLCVLAMQILLLQQFKDAPDGLDLKVWRIVQFGILLIDLGLLWGVWVAHVEGGVDWGRWEGGEWANNGILGLVAVIRSAFLLGVGGVGGVD